MSRPVLFVIDDDAGVVHALRDDLGRRFGRDFRVIGESSVAAGLAMLGQLAGEREPVALLIVGHDLNEMSVESASSARAHKLHPLAKRVLLVERDHYRRAQPGRPGHDARRGRLSHQQAVDARTGSLL